MRPGFPSSDLIWSRTPVSCSFRHESSYNTRAGWTTYYLFPLSLTILNLSTVPERKPLDVSISFPWIRHDGKGVGIGRLRYYRRKKRTNANTMRSSILLWVSTSSWMSPDSYKQVNELQYPTDYNCLQTYPEIDKCRKDSWSKSNQNKLNIVNGRDARNSQIWANHHKDSYSSYLFIWRGTDIKHM